MCENGFHACVNLVDCFNYYKFNSDNKVAEVELFGIFDGLDSNSDKICASNIKIIKELSWEFVLKNCNSGNYNSGNYNSGDYNSGNYNSGVCNSGNYNSGFFNTKRHLFFFNKIFTGEVNEISFPNFLYNININNWVSESEMSDQEKIDNTNFYVSKGYLKTISYKEAFKIAYKRAKESTDWSSEYSKLINLPNFDKEIFYEITGIDIDKD